MGKIRLLRITCSNSDFYCVLLWKTIFQFSRVYAWLLDDRTDTAPPQVSEQAQQSKRRWRTSDQSNSMLSGNSLAAPENSRMRSLSAEHQKMRGKS